MRSAGLYAGFRVRCDIPLPELTSAEERVPPLGGRSIDIAIHDLDQAGDALPPSYTPVDDTCALAHHAGRHWVRLDDDIHSAIDARAHIDVWVPLGYPRFDLRHTLLNQLLPRCISGDGFLPLHGSAVGVDGRAFAFVGPSGSGKSTLAACFASLGSDSLGDDCAMVSRGPDGAWNVSPTYAGFRLGAGGVRDEIRDLDIGTDHNKEGPHDEGGPVSKQRVGSTFPLAAASLPLGAVYLLRAPDGDAVATTGDPAPLGIRRLSPADAVAALIENSFRASIDRAALRDALGTAAAVARTVPVFALPRAAGIGQLRGFCATMFAAFANLR